MKEKRHESFKQLAFPTPPPEVVPEEDGLSGTFGGLTKGRGEKGLRRGENGLKLRNYWNFYSILFGRKEIY